MPIAVTKYRCQFKCGRSATSNKKQVEAHEVTCWNNPVNRTCKSCKNERYGWTGDGETEPIHVERGCRNALGEKYIEVNWDQLQTTSGHIKPITACPLWESKTPISTPVS